MSNELNVSDLAAGPDYYLATQDDAAPLFTADAVIEGKITKVSLNDMKGKWGLLFFYPSDFTFV